VENFHRVAIIGDLVSSPCSVGTGTTLQAGNVCEHKRTEVDGYDL